MALLIYKSVNVYIVNFIPLQEISGPPAPPYIFYLCLKSNSYQMITQGEYAQGALAGCRHIGDTDVIQ